MNSSGVFFHLPKSVQEKENMIPSATTPLATSTTATTEPSLPKADNVQNLRRVSDCPNTIPPPTFLKSSNIHTFAWDQCEVYPTSSFECQWAKYGSSVSVCLNPEDPTRAYVNHIVQETARWPGCAKLIASYEELKSSSNSNINDDDEPLLFVEVGSYNVCTLDMLLSTNANVVVFENNGEKLHAITSTIVNLPRELRQRIVVFPTIALPTEPMLHPTHDNRKKKSRRNFFFNTKSKATQDEEVSNAIPLSAMNSIFKNTNIALLKIDAPGVSCNVLEQWNRCTITYEPPSLDSSIVDTI